MSIHQVRLFKLDFEKERRPRGIWWFAVVAFRPEILNGRPHDKSLDGLALPCSLFGHLVRISFHLVEGIEPFKFRRDEPPFFRKGLYFLGR